MPNRNGEPVIDPVQQSDNTFFTMGPSDPRKYAGKNGVGSGNVPIVHEGAGGGYIATAKDIGMSRPGIELRPERQTKSGSKNSSK